MAWQGSLHLRNQGLGEQTDGRQGPPSCIVERYPFTPPYEVHIRHGIVGIANVRYITLESEGGIHKTIESDCGSGKMLINATVRYSTDDQQVHDNHVQWAKQDTVDQEVISDFFELSTLIFIRHRQVRAGKKVFDIGRSQAMIKAFLPSPDSRPRRSYEKSRLRSNGRL